MFLTELQSKKAMARYNNIMHPEISLASELIALHNSSIQVFYCNRAPTESVSSWPIEDFYKPRTRGSFIADPIEETHIRACVVEICNRNLFYDADVAQTTFQDFYHLRFSKYLNRHDSMAYLNYDTLSSSMHWFQHLLSDGAQRHTHFT
ncbi:Serine/threonine-protein phosphatase 7 long form-like protein [Senna tora]|uniref:Serine/threonine-protein phosphatase 7 long form-like protein n=1 Tax=Senna tora TaxID=362788 RepID=A0A834WPG0_9FABA|nr:Serine/threonine-protein phosphatase 7 long form-like protein [Senna tora]